MAPLLQQNDRLLTDIWAATAAGFDAVRGLDFSSTLVESVNAVIDLDAARKAARGVRVPLEVRVILFLYLIATSFVLGVEMRGRNFGLASFVLLLLALSLLLISDLDRPTRGAITESQAPMQLLQQSLRSQPSEVFDRWRGERQQ